MSTELELGEILCNECSGTGFLDIITYKSGLVSKRVCNTCSGKGKSWWIDIILKKPTPKYTLCTCTHPSSSISFTSQEIVL